MTSPLHRAAHVGDLFGPLVDEQHHQLHLGVVALDRRGDRLHDRRLAGLRRRHDQAALALADRRDQVDDPRRHVRRVARVLERQLLVREQRREVFELRAVAGLLRIAAVDACGSRAAPGSSRCGRPGGMAGDVVALAQPVLAGLLHRDVDVVAAGQVAVDPQEAVALVAQVEVAGDGDGSAWTPRSSSRGRLARPVVAGRSSRRRRPWRRRRSSRARSPLGRSSRGRSWRGLLASPPLLRSPSRRRARLIAAIAAPPTPPATRLPSLRCRRCRPCRRCHRRVPIGRVPRR